MVGDKALVMVDNREIQSMIYTFRGRQVMIDSDLARLYQVTTGRLNEQVKRNIDRFPVQFMFQLTAEEYQTKVEVAGENFRMFLQEFYKNMEKYVLAYLNGEYE